MSPTPAYLAGYSLEELMAATISREIRDGEITAVGTLSPIPASAAYLALATHAPRARLIVLGGEPWPFYVGHKEFFDLAQRGKLDLFFLSGAQIDRQGNINLSVIGDYSRPKVRLPGGAGSGMLYYMTKRVILFKTDHTPRTFVEQVDFKTSAGIAPPNVYRPGGPWKVVSPLCVFRFDGEAGRLVLDSIHPGVSLDEVVANTGFALDVAGDVAMTPAPNDLELKLLRTIVRERVSHLYPQFASQAFLPA